MRIEISQVRIEISRARKEIDGGHRTMVDLMLPHGGHRFARRSRPTRLGHNRTLIRQVNSSSKTTPMGEHKRGI